MFVDFHWHARDWNESVKETVKHSLEVAEAAGLDAIAAMPNTNPPLLDLETCQRYLSLAPKDSRVLFFVHIGLTPDPEKVKRAVEATRKDARIVGLKAYWGSSTGNLLIGKKEEQIRVFETLVREGFDGVLVGHFEDEGRIKKDLYDPSNPRTWNTLCRPEIAETSSYDSVISVAEKSRAIVEMSRQVTEDGKVQIVKSLEEVGYKGKLHIAHVSTLEVIDAISNYEGPLKLTCGVSPNHFIFNDELLQGPDGRYVKCNPPLRAEETRAGILERLLKGLINDVESDHAPYDEESKRNPMPASGIVSGTVLPYVFKFLRDQGVSPSLLNGVLYSNVLKLYNIKIEKRGIRPNLKKLEELQKFYPVDSFAEFKRQYRPDF